VREHGAGEGASGAPVGTGGAKISTRGWCWPVGGNDEMKQTTVGLAASTARHGSAVATASHGYGNPRCRHHTPLSIAPFFVRAMHMFTVLKLLLGLLRIVD
jgi:hypothetical protein